jgi:uncharacterized membrane protein YccC
VIPPPTAIRPTSERQARELAPLLDDPETLREVWGKAVEDTNGKPTGAAVRKARTELVDDPTPADIPQPAARRRPMADAARGAGQDLRKLTNRIKAIADDDRFGRNKEQVASHMRVHLQSAVEVYQDLLDQLNNQHKESNQ